MRGIARALTLKNLLVPFIMVIGLWQSWRIISEFRPQMVVGTGGYVCWPLLKCAVWRNIPIVLQEQNSFPGVVIRQLAGSAKKIYLGFDGARKHLADNNGIIVSGNPVRPSLQKINQAEALQSLGLDPDKKTILILGGSQGAHAINSSVLRSLIIDALTIGYQLLWQTGKRDYKDVSVEAGDKVSTSCLFPFAENMAQVYSAADFVIARAGALTIAEVLHFQLPSLLIPYPFAAGDHQRKNAEEMVSKSLALMIDEKDLEHKNLLKEAISFMESDAFVSTKLKLEQDQKDKKTAVDIIASDIIEELSTLLQSGGNDETVN